MLMNVMIIFERLSTSNRKLKQRRYWIIA
jgi:hypothetical protein